MRSKVSEWKETFSGKNKFIQDNIQILTGVEGNIDYISPEGQNVARSGAEGNIFVPRRLFTNQQIRSDQLK